MLAVAQGTAAQTTLKCRDKAGKITYSSEPCESLGLKNEGEVPNRVSVTPATKAPPRTAASAPPLAPERKVEAAPTLPPPAVDAEAERRCFKTANGTRCNDVPETPGALK